MLAAQGDRPAGAVASEPRRLRNATGLLPRGSLFLPPLAVFAQIAAAYVANKETFLVSKQVS